MARLFVFIVILVIFSQCYLAGSEKNRKMVAWYPGESPQPRYFQRAKSYEK